MEYPRLTIKSDGEYPLARYMKVYLDGKELTSLTHLSFDSDINAPTVVFMRLKAFVEVVDVPILIEPDNVGKLA
jgi:hypothetical protein